MAQTEKKIRVLLTKSRLDGHDRGVRYMARKFMEAGIEVIFTRYAVPEDIVKTAMEEDVDVIGISFSVGRPPFLTAQVMKLLKEKGMGQVKVIVGGIIPDDDIPELLKMGAGKTFGPGAKADDAVQFITSQVKAR